MRRISVHLLVFILLVFLFNFHPYDSAQGGPTYISSTTLNSNTTWNLSGSPYIITDNLTVPAGTWLYIDPGVEVRFNPDVRLWIYGTLYAIGNESNPVVFTSNKTNPAKGNWASIRIEEEANGSASELRFASIQYSVIGISCEGSSPIITNNRIENILSKGISLEYSEAYIANNTIINSSSKGIDSYFSNPIIQNNIISNCDYYGMKFYQSSPIIENNIISDGLTGIELKGSTARIDYTNVSDTKYGIESDKSDNLIIENASLFNNDYGIYIVNSKGTHIYDSLFSRNKNSIYSLNSSSYFYRTGIIESEVNDFILKDISKARLIDTDFNTAKNQIQGKSEIEVLNYLGVYVANESNAPFTGVEVTIFDNTNPVAILNTNENGTIDPILIMDMKILDGGLIEENTTLVNVSYFNYFFLDSPRDVDMSVSHTEIFTRINMAPDVTINNPDDMYRFNGTLIISGTASDVDGNITDVMVLVEEGSWIPATDIGINWSAWEFELNSTYAPDGYYTITVNTTDNEGAFSTAKIIVIVDNFPNFPPSLNINSPNSGDVVNQTVMIMGTAADNDGIVQTVEIQIDYGPWQVAQKNSSDWSTWRYNWDSTLYSEGNHTINARSMDEEEAYSTTHTITTAINNFDNFLPSVSFVSHLGDEVVNGIVILRGTSSDEDGIVNEVEIQIDDGAWQLVVDTGIDYSAWDFTWDTTLYSNGEHIVNVRAIDNEKANSVIQKITLIVNNGGNMPPNVKIISHNNDEEIKGSVIIIGESSDSDGKVDLVQIKVNGGSWENATKENELWSSWSFSLDTTLYTNGEHIIRAKSSDNTSANSAIYLITVVIDNGGNMPPEVYITSHNDGEKVNGVVYLKGISHDRDGFINKVEIQIDNGIWLSTQEILSDWSAWSFSLDTTLYSNGVHMVNAKCTDNDSMVSTIHSIEITVDNGGNLPPMVDITSHADGETVKGKILIKGIALDTDGLVQYVMIRIENGTWQTVTKTMADWSIWSFNLDTTKYENGDYTFIVNVTDNQTAWAIDTIILHIENEETIEEPGIETDLSLWEIFIFIIIFFIIVIIILVISMRSYHKKLEKIKEEIKKEEKKKRRKKRTKKVNHTPTNINPLTQKIDDTIEELEKFEEFIEDNP